MSDRTPCEKLMNMETVCQAFKNNQPAISDRIISCFYACYRLLFIKWAKITYQRYPEDMIEFAANNSFTDGVMKLRESAGRDELYQSSASVKTVLFHFCRNLLLGHLTSEKRLAEKKQKLAPFIAGEITGNAVEAEGTVEEDRCRNLARALEKMPAADRQIIRWRHLEGKSNDEIARLLAITVASATNRIYRCMQRLRELVDDMENENH